ncbi:Phosphoglycerate dehydrogenase-like oxidoreductase [Syntrophobacter sp. SbD1]|nr:Phosphoglycerate dehydrogenase-like oxidoreductase [Syntrophobacter sp. SbD1]
MKVLFCSKAFPNAFELLKVLLPDEDVFSCEREHVVRLGMATDVLIPLMHRLEPELIEGTAAKLIHQWGVGLEGVDIAAATARGIMVCNVPGDATANADSTAEHALFLMLAVARRIHECFGAFHQGAWGTPLGQALGGGAALIVGLGRVGKALARKLVALGMNVQAVRRSANIEMEAALGLVGAGNMSRLYEMASSADFVISTIALTDHTRALFNRDLFRVMKPSAFVINVSRGPVIVESDLVEALRTGEIAGAGLDVYEQEPLDPNNPLLILPNVVATPHIGGVTRQNYDGIARIVTDNILRVKCGKVPMYCVNESALKAQKDLLRTTG